MTIPQSNTSTHPVLVRVGVLLAATLTAQLLSSCGSEGSREDKGNPSSASASDHPSPVKSPSPADPETQAKSELLRVYVHFWDEQVKAYTKASLDGTLLTKYATGEALARAEGDLMSLKKAGSLMRGRPTNSPKVTSIDLHKQAPKAQITDCLDVSKWEVINSKTGKSEPNPNGQLTRYSANVSAEKWGTQWMILRVTLDERAC